MPEKKPLLSREDMEAIIAKDEELTGQVIDERDRANDALAARIRCTRCSRMQPKGRRPNSGCYKCGWYGVSRA